MYKWRGDKMELYVKTASGKYPIYLGRDILDKIKRHVSFEQKILLITDENIPIQLRDKVKAAVDSCYEYVCHPGEKSKTLTVYESIIKYLIENHFSRMDIIIALGGGVIGDLSGFVAATYLRGIAYINIPTTTLAQIDSSIGGKVAINVENTKNMIGSFYPPQAVIIDFDTLKSLDLRNYESGLAEAMKCGMIADASLFSLFEHYEEASIEEIVFKSLMVKKNIVEQDEREGGLRKVLNFGHTLGHGFESYGQCQEWLHGEAVALGIYKIVNEDLKKRLRPIYEKLHWPTECVYDKDRVYDYILNDKKANHNFIDVILVEKIGECKIQRMHIAELKALL